MRLSTLLCAVLLAAPAGLQAGTPILVKDIKPLPTDAPPGDSRISELTAVGNQVYFQLAGESFDDPASLWVTDGTALGTRDLAFSWKIVGKIGRTLIFLAGDGRQSSKIWRTDGTRAGTFDLTPADALVGNLGGIAEVLLAGERLFFTLCISGEQCSPWTSDGTLSGTRQILDLPSPTGFADGPHSYVQVGSRVFFLLGSELWRTDGTVAGTVLVYSGVNPQFLMLTAAGNKLYFLNGDNIGINLWASDGTAAGTGPLTQFPTDLSDTFWLKAIGDRIYFLANDVHGDQIWRSDGTPEGTVRVTNFGSFTNIFPLDQALEEVGGRLVFVATDGPFPRGLWATDGSPASTVPLCTGPTCPQLSPPTIFRLIPLSRRLLFTGFTSEHGTELWATDGTPGGTRRLTDLCPGSCSGVGELRKLGDAVFFEGKTAPNELPQLWRTDGTATGTRLFARAPRSSELSGGLAAVGDSVFFAGQDQQGRELWVSRGLPGTSRLVADLSRRTVSSFPTSLVDFNGRLLFFASQLDRRPLWISAGSDTSTLPIGSPGETDNVRFTVAGGQAFFWRFNTPTLELWRTDGTALGLQRLKEFPLVFSPTELARLGSQVFFGYNSESGDALWKSDGTLAGTEKVMDLNGTNGSYGSLTSLGSELYFVTEDDESSGSTVWRSDGTAAGTRILAGGFDFSLAGPRFHRAGGTVYFFTRTAFWRSDGTPAGTFQVSTLGDVSFSGPLANLHGDLFFFTFGNDVVESVLWRSDGTAAGTRPLLSLDSQSLNSLVVLGDALFFTARDSKHGQELWRSDGTPEGTKLLRDLSPGPLSSNPQELTVAGGRLYFRASDPIHGTELWQSDGTAAGTRLVQDLRPGLRSSQPEQLTVSGDRLYFVADDGLSGREPWSLPLEAIGCRPSPTRLCLQGGRFQVEATWKAFGGLTGAGTAVPLTGDTGYFWFFDPANVELVTKVLDAEALNQHFWVFYGDLSDVEYTLTVTDTRTGASRRYLNNAGELASVGDTQAFGPLGAAVRSPAEAPERLAAPLAPISERSDLTAKAPCVPGPQRLCLNGGRFAVTARWQDFQNHTGAGTAVGLTSDTGYFWFFDLANVEVVLKVLDGRKTNGNFWVFYGALSNVAYTLTVTDSQTGAVRTYANPSGRFASVADTRAF